MPLVAWSRRPQSKTFLSRSGGDLAGTVRETMSKVDGTQCERGPTCGDTGAVSGLFDPRVAAWMLDTGSSTDKTLEFEALCVSWLKDQAGKAGELFGTRVFIVPQRCCYDYRILAIHRVYCPVSALVLESSWRRHYAFFWFEVENVRGCTHMRLKA